MFRFSREKILPLFLARDMTITDLARQARVAYSSAEKAINGESVSAPIVNKIARALKIYAWEYLEAPPQKGDCNSG